MSILNIIFDIEKYNIILNIPRNNGNAVEEIKINIIELFALNIFSIIPVS